jgi:putative spermidine/putrescine transport system substrate-binding protein
MSDCPHGSNVNAICAILRTALAETRGFGRREFIKALGAAFAGSTIAGFPAGAASQPVTVYGFGGAWKKAALEAFANPFTQQTSIPVRYQDPFIFAKLMAMHQAHAMQIDTSPIQGEELYQAQKAKMMTPLDFSVIDRSAIDPRQIHLENSIGSHTLSYVICYSKKKWPGEHHPASWADFWNVDKFPGRRALRGSDELWTVEAALKADGVKDSEFYPLDVDRAFRSLDRIKPHIKAWWSDNSLSQQLIEQGDVDLIGMMCGRATESIRDHHAPFEMVWNEAICEGGAEGWIVPVGSPNPKGGMKFLDFVGRAEYQAVFARLIYYGPQNPKAYDLIDPQLAKLLPTYPANEKLAHMVDFSWWATNLTIMQRRFQLWLQS